MNTGLKDIKGRKLLIGDTIAMCSWNYSLEKFGKTGHEYQYEIGKVFFEKGKVQWGGSTEFDHKLYDNNFLIIKRRKKPMVEVDKDWDWNHYNLKRVWSL